MMPPDSDEIRVLIDRRIRELIEDTISHGPEHTHTLIAKIYTWMRHYLENGGRRMHGICVALASEACGGEVKAIVPVAAALQLYHHQTLVHDDIYDQDAARRGWPTTHRVFARLFDNDLSAERSDNTLFVSDARRRGAIIAFAYGKICRAMAWQLLTQTTFSPSAVLDIMRALDEHDVHDNVAQILDVYHERDHIQSAQECLELAYAKTGRLFELCAHAGARLAEADALRLDALRRWAGLSGLAYQVQDDIEDLSPCSEKGQGRGVGSDLMLAKATFIYAIARERASRADSALLDRWQVGDRDGLCVNDVTDVLIKMGALDAGREEVRALVGKAAAALRAHFPARTCAKLISFTEYFVSTEYWERTIKSDNGRANALVGVSV